MRPRLTAPFDKLRAGYAAPPLKLAALERKSPLKLRLNGAPALEIFDYEKVLSGPPAQQMAERGAPSGDWYLGHQPVAGGQLSVEEHGGEYTPLIARARAQRPREDVSSAEADSDDSIRAFPAFHYPSKRNVGGSWGPD